jgi:DNA-binding LytR/AlgR family response regulator
MITAIAIDDEPLALNVIEHFCKQVPDLQLVKTFTQPREALAYLTDSPTDLLFLDINMPSLNGIDLYKSLKQDTMVIFTTAYSEYAVESYELSAIDYLLKPFTKERFEQAITKAKEYAQYVSQKQPGTNYLFIRADYSLVKINPEEILFIEGLDDYIKVHIHQQKTVVARSTMKAIFDKLPSKEFVRVHRSYIIPIKRIELVRNKSIKIGNTEIPIGNSYEQEFMQLIKGR